MRKILLIMLSIFLLVLSDCGGGGGSVGEGTIKVNLTDNPVDYDGVFITIEKVLVHQSVEADEQASGWKEVALNSSISMPINLLQLQDASVLLAQGALTAGHYQQIRLLLKENTDTETFNYVLLKPAQAGGAQEKVALEIPAEEKNKLKIVRQFRIVEGGTTELTVDFNAMQSVVETAEDKFTLKPVIQMINEQNLSETALNQEIETIYNEIIQTIGEAKCSDDQQCGVTPIVQNPCGEPGVYLAYSTQDTDTAKLFKLAVKHIALMWEWYKLTGQTSACGLIALPRVACIDNKCKIKQY